MQTKNDNKYISLLGKHVNYMLSFSFQIYFQRQETQNKKENTKEAINIHNKIEEGQI